MAGQERIIRESAACIQDVHERLAEGTFTVVDETNPEFGLNLDFRAHVLENYFRAGVIQPETYEKVFPPNRERAREVVHYADQFTGWLLKPHVTAAIDDRSGFDGVREYPRFDLVQDELFVDWVEGVLSLLPFSPDIREGTLGVNLFRTRGDIVSGPHQDNERFIVIYVLDRQGEGGMSELYELDSDEPCFQRVIKPGQYFIFDDRKYKHHATSLTGEGAFRDVIVLTVNKPTTYAIEPMPGVDIGALLRNMAELRRPPNSA